MADKTNYRVYQVTNNLSVSKGKKYYLISAIDNDEDLKIYIRAMVSSPGANGGIKTISKAMKAAGDDYAEDFSVKTLAKGLDKKSATILRNRYKDKTPEAKTYNKPKTMP